MTESVMTARDMHRATKADLSSVGQLRRSYGVDVEEFETEDALQQAVRDRRRS